VRIVNAGVIQYREELPVDLFSVTVVLLVIPWQKSGNMIEPLVAEGVVSAAVRHCERIICVFIHDLNDRAAALSDVKDRVDKIHDFLINLPRSFHVAHVSSYGEVILGDILSSLVQVENELQSVGSMSMLEYGLNRDSGKHLCRIHLDEVAFFISKLKRHVSYQISVGVNTKAKMKTHVGQELPHNFQRNVRHNLNTSSEPKTSEFSWYQERTHQTTEKEANELLVPTMNIFPLNRLATRRMKYNEIFLHDDVDLIGRELGDMEASYFAKSLMGSRARVVTRLLLDNNTIGHEGVAAIAVALAFDSNLQELALDLNDIRDKGAMAIAEALKTNKTLQYLRLGKNNIGDEGAKAIAEALKSNSTLRYLALQKNHICNAGAKAIAETLREDNSTLRQLWLSHNFIADEGAIMLAEALKYESKSTLQILSLQHNLICDAGAEAIAEALKSNNSLQILGLRNKRITYPGAMALVKALKYNSTLQYLYVETFPNILIPQEMIDDIHSIMSQENRDRQTRKQIKKTKKLD
jgi:Ran GTPase-activating protein (RanGAP) involved in mRNA processing and transport